MYPLFETIKVKDGVICNLEFHQKRFDFARKNYFGSPEPISLKEILAVPQDCKKGLFRCRVTYSPEITNIEFIPHAIRKVNSLKLVTDNDIEYCFKYSDREKLNILFQKRENCDDILIVKNGFITDSFTANSIFFDGKDWWTPNTPLLPGTQRAKLITENKIKVCTITVQDLAKYSQAGLINAIQNFENMPVINIENIEF